MTLHKARGQHYIFAHRLVPGMFQEDPSKFMAYLAQDRIKFIRFLWDRAGQNMPPDDQVAPDGIDVTLRKAERDIQVALITLPPPEATTEAHFVAPAYHPELDGKVFARYFTLEYTLGLQDGLPHTMLCGWSGTTHFNMGDGPAAEREAFFQAIQQILFRGLPGSNA